MTIRGISGAALLAIPLAILTLPSGARAWGPTAPVATPPASEPEAPPPEPPAPPDAAAPPAPEAPPYAAPPVETPPPVAVPTAPYPPPAPEEPLAPPPYGSPEETAVAAAPGRGPIARPRLSAAVGMGATFDSVGFDDGGAHTIPAFFGELGIGDGLLLGFDLGAFASQASGRSAPSQAPVDRLALDGFGVIRPAARYQPGDQSYPLRVLRALAAELGLGFERDGRSAISGTRFTVHTGARVDLPLSPAGEPTDLRLRFAVRRDIGLYTPMLRSTTSTAVTSVGDSAAELYAALVVVF